MNVNHSFSCLHFHLAISCEWQLMFYPTVKCRLHTVIPSTQSKSTILLIRVHSFWVHSLADPAASTQRKHRAKNNKKGAEKGAKKQQESLRLTPDWESVSAMTLPWLGSVWIKWVRCSIAPCTGPWIIESERSCLVRVGKRRGEVCGDLRTTKSYDQATGQQPEAAVQTSEARLGSSYSSAYQFSITAHIICSAVHSLKITTQNLK